MRMIDKIIHRTKTYQWLLKQCTQQTVLLGRVSMEIDNILILHRKETATWDKMEAQYFEAINGLVTSSDTPSRWKKACNHIMVKRAMARKDEQRRHTKVVTP